MLADKHQKDFLLDFDNNCYCNHGSYGAAPRQVFDEKNRLLLEMESNPDKWFRETALPSEGFETRSNELLLQTEIFSQNFTAFFATLC